MGTEGRKRQPWQLEEGEQGWEWECTEGRLWRSWHMAGARGQRGAGVGSGGSSDRPE